MEIYELSPDEDREAVIEGLNQAIHEGELTENDAVNILALYDLMALNEISWN